MVDMFETKMCNYCKNSNCKKTIVVRCDKNLVTFKCREYIRDDSKIKVYEEPLVVTAKRDYIRYAEK